MGFGTGLNALLTVQEAAASRFLVYYTAVEKHPLPPEEAAQLNYAADEATGLFQNLHASLWNLDLPIHPFFTLHKIAGSLQALPPLEPFDIVYYDAFAPAAQPELWTEATFLLVYHLLRPGGILVTYCSKSIVRRAMEAAGLVVIKIPGPFGKREMVRAMRPPEG